MFTPLTRPSRIPRKDPSTLVISRLSSKFTLNQTGYTGLRKGGRRRVGLLNPELYGGIEHNLRFVKLVINNRY